MGESSCLRDHDLHGGKGCPSYGGGVCINVEFFDGHMDYMLWEWCMKSALWSLGLGNALCPPLKDILDYVWRDLQEQAIGIVHQYLAPLVFKLVKEDLNELRGRYHKIELPKCLVALLNEFQDEVGCAFATRSYWRVWRPCPQLGKYGQDHQWWAKGT